LNDEFALGLSTEDINHLGWEGELAYHGTPSGVDNTAATYGGLMLYQIEDREKKWERINLKMPVSIILGNSGITSDTSTLEAFTDRQKARDPALYRDRLQSTTVQSLAMKAALERFDLERVGRIMTENHAILIDMGLSHEILVRLCDIAMDNGALGAKVTGGGRGGYMVALTPGEGVQEKTAEAMEKEGFKVIRATIAS
jgi:mevalonate kinase